LSGEWADIFQEVLDYARELVEREEEGTLKARMNWWAALALLRCISSSPQAAIRALNTRIDNAFGGNETELTELQQAEVLETQGTTTVLDGGEDLDSADDVEPGAAVTEDLARLEALVDRARALRANNDPKLKALTKQKKTN